MIFEVGVERQRSRALDVLPLPVWGEGWGEGVTELSIDLNPLTPPLSLWEREQTESAAGPVTCNG
jgi:hypothetical protein